MKSIISNIVLMASATAWIGGVDAYPVMKILGFPMMLLALMLWVRWSNTAKRIIEKR
jgi:hypothetical protein